MAYERESCSIDVLISCFLFFFMDFTSGSSLCI